MLREAHYKELREALRKLAAQEKVIIIRFFEAMQIINQADRQGAGERAIRTRRGRL